MTNFIGQYRIFTNFSKGYTLVENRRSGAVYSTTRDGWRMHHNPYFWVHGVNAARRFIKKCAAHGVAAPRLVIDVAEGRERCAGYGSRDWF